MTLAVFAETAPSSPITKISELVTGIFSARSDASTSNEEDGSAT
jgi:hypothetical protein